MVRLSFVRSKTYNLLRTKNVPIPFYDTFPNFSWMGFLYIMLPLTKIHGLKIFPSCDDLLGFLFFDDHTGSNMKHQFWDFRNWQVFGIRLNNIGTVFWKTSY